MFELKKADRKQSKMKLGLFSPSGAGKTMSALKLARGLASAWDKIAIIDTENGSADLYSTLGDYNVVNLQAPYTPERYNLAIDACHKAGMEVIIVDSISHEWTGKGGILEIADELSKGMRNNMLVWAKLTPRHNSFIEKILTIPVHVICCGRTKQDYVLNQTEKNGRTINVPEKVGLKAITREGFEYELTIAFDIAMSHYATCSKDRTDLFMREPEFKIDEKTGETIKKWCESGSVSEPPPPPAKKTKPEPEVAPKKALTAKTLEMSIDYLKKQLDAGVEIKDIIAKISETYEIKNNDLVALRNAKSEWDIINGKTFFEESQEAKDLKASQKAKADAAVDQIMDAVEFPSNEPMEMITRTQQIQIQTERRLKKISDEDYKAMLAGFGTETSKNLNKIEAEAFLKQLKEL